MPELKCAQGYFLVLGVIAAICTAVYLRLRRLGWPSGAASPGLRHRPPNARPLPPQNGRLTLNSTRPAQSF